MKAPESKMGQFSFFFVMELLSFLVLCASTRAQAAGLYGWTGFTSLLWSAQTFGIGKLMMDDAGARSWYSGAGCIFGGCLGDLIAIWATKHLFGM